MSDVRPEEMRDARALQLEILGRQLAEAARAGEEVVMVAGRPGSGELVIVNVERDIAPIVRASNAFLARAFQRSVMPVPGRKHKFYETCRTSLDNAVEAWMRLGATREDVLEEVNRAAEYAEESIAE